MKTSILNEHRQLKKAGNYNTPFHRQFGQFRMIHRHSAPNGNKTPKTVQECLSAPDEIKNQHIVVRPGAKVTCPLAMLPFEVLLILLPLLSSEEVTDMPLLPSLE